MSLTGVGRRVIEAFSEAGYNKNQITHLVSVAWSTVNDWDRKDATPKVEHIDACSRATGRSLEYLIRGTEQDGVDRALPAQFIAWRESMAPRDLTRSEEDTLASVRFALPHPGVQWYAIALAGLRSAPVVVQATETRRRAAR